MLIGSWVVATVGLIYLVAATKVPLPTFLGKAGPFILAGFVTGWFVPVSTRRPKIIATATLVVVSAMAWTAFGVITNNVGSERALTLFVASLPVMVVASLWAYLGMYVGSRRHEQPPTAQRPHGNAELDDLEEELRSEIADEEA